MVELVGNVQTLATRVVWVHTEQSRIKDALWQGVVDLVNTIPQTAVWVAVLDKDGDWRVAQAKMAAYEVSFYHYPEERSRMHGGDAARLVRRWGQELPPDHPAYETVREFAWKNDMEPRANFVVCGLYGYGITKPKKTTIPLDSKQMDRTRRFTLNAIDNLLPMLDREGLERIQGIIKERLSNLECVLSLTEMDKLGIL
jgi:hypothetical protein